MYVLLKHLFYVAYSSLVLSLSKAVITIIEGQANVEVSFYNRQCKFVFVNACGCCVRVHVVQLSDSESWVSAA